MEETQDVFRAASWCIRNESVDGKALIVAPKATHQEAKEVNLLHANVLNGSGGPKEGFGRRPNDQQAGSASEIAIWDIPVHHYEISDVFSDWIIQFVDVKTSQRGWIGVLMDLMETVAIALSSM